MKYSGKFVVIFLTLLLGGCGQTVKESLKAPPTTHSVVGADRTVVVLPFADYSYADNLETAYRRNLFINENLTDQFTRNGFHLPVQEDVFLYLVDQNIINIVSYDNKNTKNIESELKGEWSDRMKGTLKHYMELSQQTERNSSGLSGNPGTHGLTPQEVVKIGRHFSADYIVRGRIIQYKDRLDPSWAPWKKGVVGFVTGVTNKVAFGQAATDQYDEMGNMVAGASYGALIGDGANWPYDGTPDQRIFGITGGEMGNTVVWGAIGAGLGQMAHNSGKIPQAVVQLRVWVQDAYTGNVVWTNRIDVKVSPESVLADYQYDALFESATEKAVSTLIEDFVKHI
jgi:hypothetical protein